MASLAKYVPFLRYRTVKSRTWASAGNTDTVTDGDVDANSVIVIQPTAAFAGRWHVTVSAGSFVVTSSDSEATSVTYNYEIL